MDEKEKSQFRRLIWKFRDKEKQFRNETKLEKKVDTAQKALSVVTEVESLFSREAVYSDTHPEITRILKRILQNQGPIFEWRETLQALEEIGEMPNEKFEEWISEEDKDSAQFCVRIRKSFRNGKAAEEDSDYSDKYDFSDITVYLDWAYWVDEFDIDCYRLGKLIRDLLMEAEQQRRRGKEIGVVVLSQNIPEEVNNLLNEVKRLYITGNDAGCIVFCRALLEHALADKLPGGRQRYQNIALADLLGEASEKPHLLPKAQLNKAHEVRETARNILHICGDKKGDPKEIALHQAKATFKSIESLYAR